jgi:hypothetical protein
MRCGCHPTTEVRNRFQSLGAEHEDPEEDTEPNKNKKVFFEKVQEKKPTMPRVRKWKKNEVERTGVLTPIRTIEPEGLHKISSDGQWEEIELAVDSGATESVCPNELAEHVPTIPGAASKRGVMYEVASGHQIPNEGEKKLRATTEDGFEKNVVLQVAEVNQGLLSVSKATAAGNRVVFDEGNSYIENKRSGVKTWLKEKNGMYILKLFVKRPF